MNITLYASSGIAGDDAGQMFGGRALVLPTTQGGERDPPKNLKVASKSSGRRADVRFTNSTPHHSPIYAP